MIPISHSLISWQIDQPANPEHDNVNQDMVSLRSEGTNIIIRDTRTPRDVLRFSLGSVNPMYAANIFRLFKDVIGDHLNEATPQQGCFLPLLLYTHSTPTPHQLALFGYTTNQSPPLQRWKWVVLNECSRSMTSFFVNDAQAQRYLESLRLSELSALSFENRNKPLKINVAQAPDGQITEVNIKFAREDSLCMSTLSKYLANPADHNALKTLKQLGLSPEQISVLCTDDELRYFRSLTSSLKDLPEATAITFIENLEQHYPTLYPILFQELIVAHNAQQQTNDYSSILQALEQQVSGQEYAIKTVATALNGQIDSTCNAYLLFVGPSGVGKTETAKAASTFKGNRMVRFDMDQFTGEHDFHKLFGSPTGYTGSTDNAFFAKAMDPYVHKTSTENGMVIKEVRNMVVLFDELEKAHHNVKQAFLTLFGEGYAPVTHTDDKKNVVTRYVFTKCLFIGTSNAYQTQIVQDFQRDMLPSEIATHFTQLNAQDVNNRYKYSPELLGRLHTTPFSPIPRAQFPELVKRKLSSLLSDLHEKVGCKTLTISGIHHDSVIRYLSNTLYGDGTGIRRLQQYFEYTVYQNICEQAETWGNFKDKEMVIIPFGQGLGITCKQVLYRRVIREYPSIPVRMT